MNTKLKCEQKVNKAVLGRKQKWTRNIWQNPTSNPEIPAKSEQTFEKWTKCEQAVLIRKNKWTRQNWQIRACFSKKVRAFLSLKFSFILLLGLFFKEICTCFRRNLLFFCRWNLRLYCVFQGNLHLFSMEFALTFQRNLHLFRRWNLHVFFGEIRASFCCDEICVSFFDEFFTCFLMKFSFVGFKKFRFLAIILKNMRD